MGVRRWGGKSGFFEKFGWRGVVFGQRDGAKRRARGESPGVLARAERACGNGMGGGFGGTDGFRAWGEDAAVACGRAGGAGFGFARRGRRREEALLPELEQVFQAGEEGGEQRVDQGLDGVELGVTLPAAEDFLGETGEATGKGRVLIHS